MCIEIQDLTPNKYRLEMIKIKDVYGTVIVTRGWL